MIDESISPTCRRQEEVLALIRRRGYSLRRVAGRDGMLRLEGNGAVRVIDGLRFLTIADVHKLGPR